MYSSQTATDFVIGAVEATGCASRSDFDIDTIVEKCHDLAEGPDIQTLDRQMFWSIAAANMRG